MAKDIVTKAEILGGEIDVRANFGQTVKVTVSPDPYMGVTEVTPSDQTQVLQTKKKFVQEDITVYPAPTELLSTTSNGTFTPSSGKVGFSAVTVDVNPDLRPLSVSENGTYEPDGFDGYSDVTVDVEPNLTSLSATENGLYLPESGTDGFDRVSVDVPVPSGSTTIAENGNYDVTDYESAVVNVPDKYLLSTHVLEEDKLSGTYPSYWLRTYMPWCIPWEEDDMNLYMMTFEGNEASQYRATTCFLNALNHQQYVFSRAQTGARVLVLNIGNDGGYDFWATAGTVIKVYKFPPVI